MCDSSPLAEIHNIVNTVIESLQVWFIYYLNYILWSWRVYLLILFLNTKGFVVAFIYCFFNSEVKFILHIIQSEDFFILKFWFIFFYFKVKILLSNTFSNKGLFKVFRPKKPQIDISISNMTNDYNIEFSQAQQNQQTSTNLLREL